MTQGSRPAASRPGRAGQLVDGPTPPTRKQLTGARLTLARMVLAEHGGNVTPAAVVELRQALDIVGLGPAGGRS